MIDPIHSLAFSMQANRGIYAILLGSGISRAAGIPTGWEITLDLVHRLAVLHGEDATADPEKWYIEKFSKTPDYSVLLDALAKTPAERQQLLRTYWEPNEQEREDNLKQPTLAHHAIARLAAQGFVRLIITTNFDRLMEYALDEAGIVPTVLSSPDHVHGALPLIHTRCCLLKIHGDYLDTRILNTPSELAEYPTIFNSLLDRVFDEFGLVVCGWSADWDDALRSAITRAPSRRFATYWTAQREPSDKAKKLIEHRAAQLVAIKDADSFFQSVQQHVESLEQFAKPHPLSTEAAVSSLKRYLSEPRYRIQLADLVGEVVDRIIETTSGPAFVVLGGPTPNGSSMTARVRGYEAACATLLAIAVVGGYWAEIEHYPLWQRALERLSSTPRQNGGYTLWLDLQRYPGTLLLYGLGLGAVEGEKLEFLGKIFSTRIHEEYRQDVFVLQKLPPFCLLQNQTAQGLEGMDRRYAPLNDWIYAAMREPTKSIFPAEHRYTLAFDRLEILIALSHLYQTNSGWAPPGAFGYRRETREKIMSDIKDSISKLQNDSPYVKSEIFGVTTNQCLELFKIFEGFSEKISSRWW